MTQQGKRLGNLRRWANAPDAAYDGALAGASKVAGGVQGSLGGSEISIHRAMTGYRTGRTLADYRARTSDMLSCHNWAAVGDTMGICGFDFTSGGIFDGPFSQLNPVIGMDGVDSLSYAPHALQNVWSEPSNQVSWANDFLNPVWTKGGAPPVVIRQINENEFQFDQVAGSTDLTQNVSTGKSGEPYTWAYFIPDGQGGNTPDHLRIIFMDVATTLVRVQGWVDFDTGAAGTFQAVGNATLLGGGGDRDDAKGGYWAYMQGHLNAGEDVNGFFIITTATADQSTARDEGKTFIFRDAWVYPGTKTPTQQQSSGSPYVETGAVAALGNWGTSGGATISLAFDQGKVRYKAEGPDQSVVYCEPGGFPEVPHTLGVNARLVQGDSYALSFGGTGGPESEFFTNTLYEKKRFTDVPATPANGRWQMRLRSSSGNGIAYFDLPEMVEGNELFGVETKGAARYLMRCQDGVGRLSEPDVTNKCTNYSVAPTDTTGITDSGATTTVVVRSSLPSALQTALDSFDPDGTITAMYRTQGSGTAYVTGPTGNTNEHFVRGLLWAETGTAGAVLGIENNGFAPVSAVETLEWVGGKATPLAATDRWSLAVVSGDVYWIANMLHEGDRSRSHIPVGGSLRTRSADKPVAATDDLGIDRGRNSNKQTSVAGASTPSTFPTNWDVTSGAGLTWSVAAVGLDYIDARISGTSTGGIVSIVPGQLTDTVAATGQTWFGIADLALVAGDLTNVTGLSLNVEGRDALGAFLEGSGLSIVALIGTDQRTFSLSRTMSNAGTLRANSKLDVTTVAGAVDATFRIWCGENTAWALQKTTEQVRRPLTTGTAIEFQQWIDGLTVVDEWDVPAIEADFLRFHFFYGETPTGGSANNISLENSTGASQASSQFTVTTDGTGVTIAGANSVGLHTYQESVKNADQQFWQDGSSQGTAAGAMPVDIHSVMLGDHPTLDRNRDGIQKRWALFPYRATGALT